MNNLWQLILTNKQIPSVQHRYEQLQKHNNQLEFILRTKSKGLQDLNSQIPGMSKDLDAFKLVIKIIIEGAYSIESNKLILDE